MAGDWIPYCCDLPRKPEVLAVAEATGLGTYEVTGALMELWAWADSQTPDGVLCHAPVTQLSRVCPLIDARFVAALEACGWLALGSGRVTFPNFDRWMGNAAKKRLQAAIRKRHQRQGQPNVSRPRHASVTQKSRLCPTNSGTTEQNSTEEKKRPPDPPSAALPGALDTPELRAAWARWLAHRKETGKPLRPTAAAAALRKLEAMGPARALAALEHSLAHGWQGVFEPKEGGRERDGVGRGDSRVEAPPGKYDGLPLFTPPAAPGAGAGMADRQGP